MNKLTKLATLLVFLLLWLSPAFSHDHLKAEYVPWGVDEYELFGLTKAQLSKGFKNQLHFNYNFTDAYIIRETYGPHFLLTYANDHVSNVQRMFIDGGGCHIMGPILKSEKEALQFSIAGLTALPNKDKKDQQRLLSAKKLLNASKP